MTKKKTNEKDDNYRKIFSTCILPNFPINSYNKKPYTIGEELIKPCILPAAKQILGPEAAQKFDGIPLSNNTAQQRIEDIAMDIEQEVKKSPYFAIQLDESTDVSNCAILLCFVRYKEKTDFKEEFLCYIDLLGRTTGSEIFRLLNTHFS